MALPEIDSQPEDETPDTDAAPEGDQQPGRIAVDVSDDDDDESPAQPEEKKTRRTRMRELRQTLKSERTERERLAAEVAELRGRISGIAQQPREAPRQQEDADPIGAEYESLVDQQQGILAQMRAEGVTDSQLSKLRSQYNAIDRKKIALVAASQAPRESGQSQGDIENQILASEFPEVFGDPVRLTEAKLELMKLARTKRLPMNLATARLAAKTVAERYARPTSKPSAAAQARHASVPGQAGTGGGPQRFTPTSQQLRAARAYTNHREGLSDEERVKIWYREVGKKHGIVK